MMLGTCAIVRSPVLGAVSVGAFIVMGIQGGIFATSRTSHHCHRHLFRSIMRQDVASSRKGKHGRRVDHVASGGYHKGSNDDWTEFRSMIQAGGATLGLTASLTKLKYAWCFSRFPVEHR